MAATASSLATASALLKQHYLSPEVIQNVMIEAGPFITELLMKADTGCGGANIPFPIITASGGGVGSIYSTNQQNTLPSVSSNFLLTRGTTFGIGQIGGEVLEASENPDDAFIKNLTLEVDAKKKRVLQMMAHYAYGDGTGTAGRISTGQTLASSTLVLDDPTTVFKFQVNDAIQISATVGGAARNAGAIGYIVGINQIGTNAGQLIMSSTPSGTPTNINTIWAAVAAGDFIYFAGDVTLPTNVGGSGPAIIQGAMAWAPPGGPGGADNFFGINRQNQGFLYGQIIDATSNSLNLGSIREALTVAVTQLHQVSGRPSRIYMNPLAYYKLSLSLQSQGLYQPPANDGEFGFSSLGLPTPHGTIKVYMDPQCCPFLNPTNYPVANGYNAAMAAYVAEFDTLELVGKGEIPHLDEADIGNYFLRLNTADAYQYQFKAYWQFGSHAPNHSAWVLLPQ